MVGSTMGALVATNFNRETHKKVGSKLTWKRFVELFLLSSSLFHCRLSFSFWRWPRRMEKFMYNCSTLVCWQVAIPFERKQLLLFLNWDLSPPSKIDCILHLCLSWSCSTVPLKWCRIQGNLESGILCMLNLLERLDPATHITIVYQASLASLLLVPGNGGGLKLRFPQNSHKMSGSLRVQFDLWESFA